MIGSLPRRHFTVVPKPSLKILENISSSSSLDKEGMSGKNGKIHIEFTVMALQRKGNIVKWDDVRSVLRASYQKEMDVKKDAASV